jgi:hypothetical protein
MRLSRSTPKASSKPARPLSTPVAEDPVPDDPVPEVGQKSPQTNLIKGRSRQAESGRLVSQAVFAQRVSTGVSMERDLPQAEQAQQLAFTQDLV